jgi:ribosome maturation factor RimP
MPDHLSQWQERLGSVLEEEGAELLEAQVARLRNLIKLRFFVDREAGLTVDDLAHLSRRIALVLDADPTLIGKYELEVSSPGMDRVVRTEAHFRRFVGEKVHVWTPAEREGQQHFEGTILDCMDGVVLVQVDGRGPTEFPLAQIERAELRLDPRRPLKRPHVPGSPETGEVPKNGE